MVCKLCCCLVENYCLLTWQTLTNSWIPPVCIPAKPKELPLTLLLPSANVLLGLWALSSLSCGVWSKASAWCCLFQVFTHPFRTWTPCTCHLHHPTLGHLLQDPQLLQPGWAQECQVNGIGQFPGSECRRMHGLGWGWHGPSMGWRSCCCKSSKSSVGSCSALHCTACGQP